MPERHSLLARQIRRHLGGEEGIPESCLPFVKAVDEAYRQSDHDRAMLERSMDLSSQELLQANAALRQSLSMLQATLDSTADGILVVDLQGRIQAFNRKFADMWRLPEPLFQTGFDEPLIAFVLDQIREPEAFLARVREVYSDPDIECQDVLEFKDGRVFERYSQPQRIGGRSVGRVWSFRDVTERRRAEEERSRLQVMGALGHLVGGLAHEVRNPLFAITATVDALMSNLDDSPQNRTVRQALQGLLEPTARLSELMSDLLEYGKPLGRNLSPGSLGGAVLEAVTECRPLALARGVALRTELGERELLVGMIRRRFLMALTNLIQNAIQHTPAGGEVVLEVSRVEEGGRAWARCAVLDSGPGFREEDLPRLFEPFFTRRRGGTGLGLSIVQRVAEEQQAGITAANRPGGGAAVTLDIPEWEGPRPEAPPLQGRRQGELAPFSRSTGPQSNL